MNRRKKSQRRKEVVVEETTRFATEPTVEIRKPTTLAQALTEPAVAVVKPQTKTIRERKVKRAA